jgi:hypothetical protein
MRACSCNTERRKTKREEVSYWFLSQPFLYYWEGGQDPNEKTEKTTLGLFLYIPFKAFMKERKC